MQNVLKWMNIKKNIRFRPFCICILCISKNYKKHLFFQKSAKNRFLPYGGGGLIMIHLVCRKLDFFDAFPNDDLCKYIHGFFLKIQIQILVAQNVDQPPPLPFAERFIILSNDQKVNDLLILTR